MNFSIFWSWQSDTRANCNRTIIHDCIKDAMESISKNTKNITEYEIYESTVGVSGTPSITEVIIDRITNSNVYIADLTLVGKISEEKMTPNPNVLVELGFAASQLGWGNVITVMNTHFGDVDKLPFDLKNRRFPLTYSSSPDETDRQELKRSLTKEIKKSLSSAIDNQEQKIHRTIEKLDINCLMLLNLYKDAPYFSSPTVQNEAEAKGTIDLNVYRFGIPRLLDIGLIRTDFDKVKNLYAYHWTYLGHLVLERRFKNE